MGYVFYGLFGVGFEWCDVVVSLRCGLFCGVYVGVICGFFIDEDFGVVKVGVSG